MKRVINLFLLLILILPMISALEINMNSEISKGETVLASISDQFLEQLTKENIRFYRDHVPTSFDYDITRIGEEYYISFQTAGKAVNNYSINISGIRYFVGAEVSNVQISKKFKIINETADFSVNPEFIVTSENFSIKIQNLQASSLIINLETEIISGSSEGNFEFVFIGEEIEQEIILNSGELRTLYINLGEVTKTTIRKITLSASNTEYSLPCYIIGKENIDSENQEEEEIEEEENEETEQEEINLTEENCSFFEILFGTCDENKTKEETNSNESEDLEEDKEENNKEKENETPEVDYEVVKQGNKTVAIKDGKVLNGTATMKTCEQINGEICLSEEFCKNETIYTKHGQCCISECLKKEKSKSTKTLGWMIIALIIIMILWFFLKKFRGTRIKKDNLLGSKR